MLRNKAAVPRCRLYQGYSIAKATAVTGMRRLVLPPHLSVRILCATAAARLNFTWRSPYLMLHGFATIDL